MRALRAAVLATLLAAGAASAAPVFTDDFNDGSYNNPNPPNPSTNPTWQVLQLPGLNNGHAARWTVTGTSTIEGAGSARWADAPCQGQPGLEGDCFPAGVLYVDPAPSRPGQVGNYFIRYKTRIAKQLDADLNPLGFGGDLFAYASAPGILLFPPDNSGLAGGYAAGLVYNAGPNLADTSDDKIEAGIIYIEGNVQTLELNTAVLLRKPANISITNFFESDHVIQMNVRSNRYIELTIDDQYYGRADTSGQFADGDGNPFTPKIRPQNTQDVAMVGLAGNVILYDLAEYNNTPPADTSPADGVPDIFGGAPDADCDRVADASDPDDDDDGVPDFADDPVIFPSDIDGDGIPDECDPDADNDGCPDDQEGDNLDPDPADCFELCGTAGTSFDCDGDGVANDCEIECGTDECVAEDLCDTTPPTAVFTRPARGSVYAQDSMGLFVNNGTSATSISSVTVEARVIDTGSGVASVDFFVDGDLVAEGLNDPAPPYYSFRYVLDGGKTGTHLVEALVRDKAGNQRRVSTNLVIVDASALTDMVATDVTDQYAVIIEPLNPAISGSNYYAIGPRLGNYEIRYRVMDYATVLDNATVVPTCYDNDVHVIDLEATATGLTTPGAFPGFWHDENLTLANASGTCVNGVYTVRFPVSTLERAGNQPVGVWVWVDVPDRAATNGPGGAVNSASGFFNIVKPLISTSPLADRLDETPSPLYLAQ